MGNGFSLLSIIRDKSHFLFLENMGIALKRAVCVVLKRTVYVVDGRGNQKKSSTICCLTARPSARSSPSKSSNCGSSGGMLSSISDSIISLAKLKSTVQATMVRHAYLGGRRSPADRHGNFILSWPLTCSMNTLVLG